MTRCQSKIVRFILDNSLLLLAGTAVAVVWANVNGASYDAVAHPLHFWVNDVGMVFFFALAVSNSRPRSRADRWRHRAVPCPPLAAAVGGMAAPALIYLALESPIPAKPQRG
jgi:NhaA family Na+:H+ antiporter